MIGFSCGIGSEKIKTCYRCKRFFMWGIGTGYCVKHKENKYQTNHCKYYKRNFKLFAKNGQVKNQELYDEMFM